MHHVHMRYDTKLYVDALVGIILREMAWSRWSIVHEGRFGLGELDYADFVADFSFFLPESEIENTREDYLFLRELIMSHWRQHDYAHIHHPPTFNMVGNFYVFEFVFERP